MNLNYRCPAVAVLALLLVAPQDFLVAQSKFLQQSIDATTIGRVHIQAGAGQIRVRGWEERFVNIRGRQPGQDISISQVGIELHISPKDQVRGALHLDLYLPAALELIVDSAQGDIFLHGITGQINARTDSGDIHLYENGGRTEVASISGEIRLLLPDSFQSIANLRSQSGDIHTTLAVEEYKIHAASGGSIFVNGQPQTTGLNADRQLVFDTGRGDKAILRLASNSGRIVIQTQAARPAPSVAPLADTESSRATGNPNLPTPDRPQPTPQSREGLGPRNRATNSDANVISPSPVTSAETVEAGPVNPGRLTSIKNYTVVGSTVDSGYAVHTNVDYINLNVSVRDRANRSVADLVKEDFQLYEDGRLQNVEKLLTTETPFSLLLLLDVSGSTAGFIDLMKGASINFLRQLKPQDDVAVAVFNSDVDLLAQFSQDRLEAERAIRRIHSRGGTALYDALDASLHDYMAHILGRKAIVVFTDGVDNQMEGRGSGSRMTFDQLLRGIREVDTIIYPIFLDTEADFGVSMGGFGRILRDILNGGASRRSVPIGRAGQRQYYERAREEMSAVAEQTGGRVYSPRRIEDLDGAYHQIADDLRIQYTLSYVSTNPARDGKWRRIQVRIQGHPEYLARTRLGYYASDSRRAGTTKP